jgi:DNA processing protein
VLVQTPEEVVELLQSFTGAPRSRFRVSDGTMDFDFAELAEAEIDSGGTQAIAALLSNAPIAVDELIRQSGASAATVHMALLELELSGELIREADGMIRQSG